MNKFKDRIKLLNKDNTAEIKQKINEILNNNILTRRVKNAFPNYKPLIISRINSINYRIVSIVKVPNILTTLFYREDVKGCLL